MALGQFSGGETPLIMAAAYIMYDLLKGPVSPGGTGTSSKYGETPETPETTIPTPKTAEEIQKSGLY